MVMDIYDHCPPRGSHKDDMYILEIYSDKDFFEIESLRGVFDCFEAAMHAMDHLRLYDYRAVEIGKHLLISSVRKNTLRFRKYHLISWERLPDIKDKVGFSNGEFRLHDGLRTHAIES